MINAEEQTITLTYYSGTKLECKITKLINNQLRLEFTDNADIDGNPIIGEEFKLDMIWSDESKDLIWTDDSGNSEYIIDDTKTGNKWYRVWVYGFVNVPDLLVDGVSVQTQFWPVSTGASGESSRKGLMYFFAPQLERVAIGQSEPSAYVRASNPDQPITSEDWPGWTPDVDVRTVKSVTGMQTNLYQYYDYQLQKEEYLENIAPAEVQFYFYPRYKIENFLNSNSPSYPIYTVISKSCH